MVLIKDESDLHENQKKCSTVLSRGDIGKQLCNGIKNFVLCLTRIKKISSETVMIEKGGENSTNVAVTLIDALWLSIFDMFFTYLFNPL